MEAEEAKHGADVRESGDGIVIETGRDDEADLDETEEEDDDDGE